MQELTLRKLFPLGDACGPRQLFPIKEFVIMVLYVLKPVFSCYCHENVNAERKDLSIMNGEVY